MISENYDLHYLCSKMSDMSGLPIRIYRDGIKETVFSSVPLTADPLELCGNGPFLSNEHVSYFVSDTSEYYGILCCDDIRIIAGPSRNTPFSETQLSELCFRLGLTGRDADSFRISMRAIVPMPLDSVLQMLCTLNHIMSGEKLNLTDLGINEISASEKNLFTGETDSSDVYKGYAIEKKILEIVKNGDLKALDEFASQGPTVRSGYLSSGLLRQRKNIFIVTATLVSRAAIEAGVDPDISFHMSDSYIQRCENSLTLTSVDNLQYDMVFSYTKAVHDFLVHGSKSGIVPDVYNYILKHISEPVKTSDIASSLFMSRTRLSVRFKEETGKELSKYITSVKIEKAKELLADKSKSVLLIGEYLGFSSASHFSRVFKDETGVTPKQFRNNESKNAGHYR